MVEKEFFSDSFRALSAQKLGQSVLLLCAENEEDSYTYEEYDISSESEEE